MQYLINYNLNLHKFVNGSVSHNRTRLQAKHSYGGLILGSRPFSKLLPQENEARFKKGQN